MSSLMLNYENCSPAAIAANGDKSYFPWKSFPPTFMLWLIAKQSNESQFPTSDKIAKTHEWHRARVHMSEHDMFTTTYELVNGKDFHVLTVMSVGGQGRTFNLSSTNLSR